VHFRSNMLGRVVRSDPLLPRCHSALFMLPHYRVYRRCLHRRLRTGSQWASAKIRQKKGRMCLICFKWYLQMLLYLCDSLS
jgi:hypothetical protein